MKTILWAGIISVISVVPLRAEQLVVTPSNAPFAGRIAVGEYGLGPTCPVMQARSTPPAAGGTSPLPPPSAVSVHGCCAAADSGGCAAADPPACSLKRSNTGCPSCRKNASPERSPLRSEALGVRLTGTGERGVEALRPVAGPATLQFGTSVGVEAICLRFQILENFGRIIVDRMIVFYASCRDGGATGNVLKAQYNLAPGSARGHAGR